MKEVTETINEKEFVVVPFQAVEAFALQTDLLRIFGPALGTFIGGVSLDTNTGKADIQGGQMGAMAASLFSDLSSSAFFQLVQRLLKNTRVNMTLNGVQTTFDFSDKFQERFNIVFENQLMDVYKVCWLVLKANYPDFFSLLGSRIGTKTKTTQPLPGAEKDGGNSSAK